MDHTSDMPRAILFDWDGTLVDTLPWLFRAHNHVRGQLGEPLWTMEEYKNIIHYSARELYFKLYHKNGQQALDILYEYVDKNHLEALQVIDDSLPLLKTIKTLAIPCGLISNKRHEYLNREVDHLDWRAYFSVCIGAGYANKDKPAADPILKAIEEMDIAPAGNDIWYVGDSETDMKAALASGCTPVLVRHHHDNRHLENHYNPPYVFDNCADIMAYLLKTVETYVAAR